MSDLSPNLEAAVLQLSQHVVDLQLSTAAMREAMERRGDPASIETISLEATRAKKRSDAGESYASIGLINQNPITVYLGVLGSDPSPGKRSIAMPGNSTIILPVEASLVEVGADPADLAVNDAVLFLLRFDTVQPFFFFAY